jgi:hypothetical protein
VPGGNTGLSDGGQGLSLAAMSRAPGTIPSTVNPPHVPSGDNAAVAVAAAPAAPAPTTRVASASQSDGFFASLAHKMGLGGATADTTAVTPPPSPAPAKPKVADAKHSEPPKAAATRQAAHRPAPKHAVADGQTASDPSEAPPGNGLVAGAQPIVSANSFESRFSATK